MQGQTGSFPAENPLIDNAWEYRYLTDSLRPLCHPVGEDIGEGELLGAHEGGGSLLPAFCRAYIEGAGGKAVAVHAAKGATAIADWRRGTKRYARARDKIFAAIAKAEEKEKVEKICYVWLQGESDAVAGTSEKEYLESLVAYKDALKEDVHTNVFGIVRVGYFTADPSADEAIMRAQDEAIRRDKDFALLTDICARLSRDPAYLNPAAPGHYNNAGMELIGAEAGKTLARLK